MSNFAEWKTEMEQEYVSGWKKINKADNKKRFIEYLEDLLKNVKCYANFKEARMKYKPANNIDYAVSFAQFVFNAFQTQQEKVGDFKFPDEFNENSKKFYDKLAYSEGLRKHLQDNNYLFLYESHEGYWINFCSAFHKYFGLFNSWDEINDFCVHFCFSGVGDNFLYVRNLKDLCTSYVILSNETAAYRDKLYATASEKVSKIKNGKNRKINPQNAVTATSRMMGEITNYSAIQGEEAFLYFVTNNAEYFLDEEKEFVHISAIKVLYGTFYPDRYSQHELAQDNKEYRNYRDYVDELGEFYLEEMFGKDRLETIIKDCQMQNNSLKTFLLNKFIPDFICIDYDTIMNAKNLFDIVMPKLGDVLKIEHDWVRKIQQIAAQGDTERKIESMKEKLIEAESKSDDVFYERDTLNVIKRFNKSLRYLCILAEMWKLKKDGYVYNSAEARIDLDAFLDICNLRVLDEKHDGFDWFVIETLKYEEKLCAGGERENVSGIDTLLKYLCEE